MILITKVASRIHYPCPIPLLCCNPKNIKLQTSMPKLKNHYHMFSYPSFPRLNIIFTKPLTLLNRYLSLKIAFKMYSPNDYLSTLLSLIWPPPCTLSDINTCLLSLSPPCSMRHSIMQCRSLITYPTLHHHFDPDPSAPFHFHFLVSPHCNYLTRVLPWSHYCAPLHWHYCNRVLLSIKFWLQISNKIPAHPNPPHV